MLHVSGSQDAQEMAAARSGIVKGSRWDESAAGTNGMGTALATRQPVHIFATEHFCEGWHGWSCSAAPIFDIDGTTVVGIIDFTTSHADFRDQGLALTVSLANSIQARMTLDREIDRSRLLAVFSEASKRYPNDEMLMLDHAGRLVMHSPTECGVAAANRWRAGAREQMLCRVDVLSPRTGNTIGNLVHVGRRPSPDHARVFQLQDGDANPGSAAQTLRFGQFISRDPETVRMLKELEKIALADVNVLLIGETGTGKELIARHIHACSPRMDEPYLAINCGAISADLLESTFFGYVRGAFSGADPRGRAGYFESARNGTLFLDEIGELPLHMQSALLRVLEDGSFLRVGSSTAQESKCRVVAATHRNLEELVASGKFRKDLYYRLKVVQKSIKPVRDRVADISLLIEQFIRSLSEKHRLPQARVTPDALGALEQYAWPGNAREIRNVIEAALLCADGEVTHASLPPEIIGSVRTDAPPQPASSTDYERQRIIDMLRKYRKVNYAAKALGLARSTLYRKFAELGIDQREFTGEA